MTVWLWLTAAFWFWLAWRATVDGAAVRVLPGLEACPAAGSPRVTIVVAARDEAPRIETTVHRLLDQRHVDADVIVVDDRSADGTAEILEQLRREHPRLRVVRVDELPDGWIGKCHALDTGARAATGEWLLFTDADTWMAPDLIARALRTAEVERADHLTLFPSQRVASATGRAANLVFWTMLSGNAARANRDRRTSFIGVGAFNLVRADAYRAIGGHEPLRLEICDDMKLGLLLRRSGKRSRAFLGGRDLEVEWAQSARGLVRAIEKNLFAMLRYSLTLTALAVILNLALWTTAVAGPLTLRPAGLAAGLALALLAVPARRMTKRAGWGWPPALLTPLLYPILVVALVHSAWTTVRRGGVRWRDTFYPLDDLRRGVVR